MQFIKNALINFYSMMSLLKEISGLHLTLCYIIQWIYFIYNLLTNILTMSSLNLLSESESVKFSLIHQ